MSEARLYLDHNATAPVRPAVVDAITRALMAGGNASSVHGEGRRARAAVSQARRQVAALVGARAEDVVFTSGASEAAAHVLTPHWTVGARAVRLGTLYVADTEHACVRGGGRFAPSEVVRLPVDDNGNLPPATLANALAARSDAAPPMLALMLANNETGVIQPVADCARLMREAGGITICDAVQAAGRIPLSIADLDVDALLLSAHKLGGPMGVGAVVYAGGLRRAAPLLSAGGQEAGQRGGTENVPGIAGFGIAAAESLRDLPGETVRLHALRATLERFLRRLAPQAVIFGETATRLPNTTAFAIPDIEASTLMMALDLAGIAVSSGSACSSGKVGRSHVLTAMGVEPALIAGMIRFSIGWNTTENDIARFEVLFARVIAALSYNRKRRVA